MKLRQYQNDLVDAVHKAYADGYKRPCIALGCGGGKSCIVAEIARRTTAKGNRVLFLVHRKELCEQIENTFRQWGVDMNLCQIGMVQTITRRLKTTPEPRLIITDENHHAPAAGYKRIYDYFPKAYCLGVTATPIRLNGGGLGDVNDKLISGVSTKWLIDNNYLSPYEYYAPPTVSTKGLKTRAGEYVVSDLELGNAIYGDVIGYYNKLAKGKKAICYCASIKHSKEIVERFVDAGISAAHIDGDTPKQERTEIIDKFRRGDITVLSNVDLISEGFDVPDCQVAILLRPTKSLSLYIQQSMRCMRYQPGKTAIIIDHVGNYSRHGLPDAERQWNLTPAKKKAASDNQVPIKQCPKCFAVYPPANICPECGYETPKHERTVEEIKEAKLKKIKEFVLDYTSPSDCNSYDELLLYAKSKGYKRGWAYIMAKQRGFL